MKYFGVVAVILTAFMIAGVVIADPNMNANPTTKSVGKALVLADQTFVLTQSSNYNSASTVGSGAAPASPNRAPEFFSIATQYVYEGDTLKLNLQASDPDLNPVTLTAVSMPSGATFTPGTNGTGKIVWVPDYIGPNSSDGSPFTATVLASDGLLSTEKSVSIVVLNKNRNPVITAPSAVQVTAGNPLSFNVSASEPDFEAVSWRVIGAPSGSSFDGLNPAKFSWTPPLTDSGAKQVSFVAIDPSGLADTGTVTVSVKAAVIYALSIDTVAGDPGAAVTSTISLMNQVKVNGFNLLVSYDPSALSVTNVAKTGTRADYFEYYSVTQNDGGRPGVVRIQGTARLSGNALPLAAGTGPVTTIAFLIANNLDYAGLSVPVRFVFLDQPSNYDNTLTDTLGGKVPQTSIAYTNGEVDINSIGSIKVGDINLNGIAYEIGDAVYFTNYIINPARYPFNLLQYANSDVNGDGYLATVADLVRLINIVVVGNVGGKTADSPQPEAVITTSKDVTQSTFSYTSDAAVGGVLMTLDAADQISALDITCPNSNMTMDFRQDGRELRVLIYSLQGWSMAAGTQDFLAIKGGHDLTLKTVDVSTDDGRLARVTQGSVEPSLPKEYSLAQNYPNPFNPETHIEFELPQADHVSLVVYDLLGREVRALAAGEFAAGRHTLTFDGRDGRGVALASGIYLYRLETGRTSITRKMMLLK